MPRRSGARSKPDKPAAVPVPLLQQRSGRGQEGHGAGRGQVGRGGHGAGRGQGGREGHVGRHRQAGGSVEAPAFTQASPLATSAASSSSHLAASSSSVQAASSIALSVPLLSQELIPPARPGFGTVGDKCVVRAVQVSTKYLHLTREYRERAPASDGCNSLYTVGALPFDSREFLLHLEEKDTEAASSSSSKMKEFKLTLKLTSKPVLELLQSRYIEAPQDTIQDIDLVLRALHSGKYVERPFFSHELGPRSELGDGIEYWRGYFQSLRPVQMGVPLNIDISARAFSEPILVTEFVRKYVNCRDLSKPLSDQVWLKVKKALKGIKVILAHTGYAKSYTITGLSSQPTSQLMFTLHGRGTRISVAQYFREKYNIGLIYTSLPALQAGSEAKPIYLPMEISRISEGQTYTKRLNEKQVTALLRATCQRPLDRENVIKQMERTNNYNRDKFEREFCIQMGREPARVDARVLPSPILKYHPGWAVPKFGKWDMFNKRMFDGGTVYLWTCVNFSSRVNGRLQIQFCEELYKMCTRKGLLFRWNPRIPICSASPSQIERVLGDIHRFSTEAIARMGLQKGLELLLIILPDMSGSYGRIKRICETELGIVSQCCQPGKVAKLNKQYLENLTLKINVKVGGCNTVLNDAFLRRIPLVTDIPTIIFGADVTHPQPGKDSSPSIAAVVASVDWPELTKYRGTVSAQTHCKEIIEHLYTTSDDPGRGLVPGGMIRELLRAFYKSNRRKPERIIFYRDGVSESQFSQVLLHEMNAIRQACSSLEDGYLPPVTFVFVQKRHRTRLLPAEHRNCDSTDKSGNIPPGAVIDTQICHPTKFDFYLNSHAGTQGTSRPTYYRVLYDENGFSADGLQILTNNLCYTYARCTRSVSIVTPAYYAHLAASRGRCYLEGEASDIGSVSESRARSVGFRPLPVVKDNVKEVMYFC